MLECQYPFLGHLSIYQKSPLAIKPTSVISRASEIITNSSLLCEHNKIIQRVMQHVMPRLMNDRLSLKQLCCFSAVDTIFYVAETKRKQSLPSVSKVVVELWCSHINGSSVYGPFIMLQCKTLHGKIMNIDPSRFKPCFALCFDKSCASLQHEHTTIKSPSWSILIPL